LNTIKRVIGIVSGKGGVGKSLVTAMLSILINRKGYNTEYWTPTLQGLHTKMFGLTRKAQGSELGLFQKRLTMISVLCPLTCCFRRMTRR
jgi:Mrp family chromosome partitioning ATPase